ncbi:MAG: MFS transporter [Caulobacteraceae bacterium]|nr:MFS transporter [Caulobacteraceae bacterium]
MSQDVSVPYPSAARAWTALAVLIGGVLLSYADRQILALLVDPIRADLHVSDTQIGLLQGPAFALFYAVAALPLGVMVDRRRRRDVLVGGVLLWSLATALCGLSSSFATLFACRVGVAVGEACLIPSVMSFVGDAFPPRRKPAAFAVYMVVVLVGCSLALAGCGAMISAIGASGMHVGHVHAPWRIAFLLVAAPGPLFALAFAALGEPARQARSIAGSDDGLSRGRLATLGWLILGLALASVAFNMTLAWLPTVLVREHGWTGGAAGRVIGLSVAAVSLLMGLVAAVAPGLVRHRPGPLLAWAPVVMIAGAPLVLLTSSRSAGQVVTAATVAAGAALLAYGLAPVLTQAVAPNRYWGRSAAAFKLTESVIVSIGAVVIGAGSDALGPGGLARMLAIVVGAALVLGAGSLLVARGRLGRIAAR